MGLLLIAACSTTNDPSEVAVEIDEITAQALLSDSYQDTVYCPYPLTVEVREGRTWAGAEFLLYQPSTWNQQLVLYAHGYLNPLDYVGFPRDPPGDPSGELDLPEDLEELRVALLCRGYGLAASSYSANGFALKEGTRDTHLLNPLYWWYFDVPDQTYVMGHSMGGLITTLLAETFPWRYDAAVPMCGPIGGSQAQIDYIGHVRVLFDVFLDRFLMPGPDLFFGASPVEPTPLLPLDGNLDDWETAWNTYVHDPIWNLLNADLDPSAPDYAMQIVRQTLARESLKAMANVVVDGVGYHQPYVDPDTDELFPNTSMLPVNPLDLSADPYWMIPSLTESLLAALRYYGAGAQDLLDRGGGSPFDNRSTSYTLGGVALEDLPPPDFPFPYDDDYEVDRYQADWWARRYWRRYNTRGSLLVPTFSIHGVGDHDVPVLHEDIYADKVWFDSLLTTVKLPSYGHCNFNTAELLSHPELGLFE